MSKFGKPGPPEVKPLTFFERWLLLSDEGQQAFLDHHSRIHHNGDPRR